jgi:hypothetical protein
MSYFSSYDLPQVSGGEQRTIGLHTVYQKSEIYNLALIIKTNTLPILMHHMRISTNEVSSVVLSPKSWKSEKKCD